MREANEQLERKVARRTAELSAALEQLADANARLRESSQRDGLTGMHNRRHFREGFEQMLHAGAPRPGSRRLLMIDLDHFKQINDSYGHLAGDECLRWAGAHARPVPGASTARCWRASAARSSWWCCPA